MTLRFGILAVGDELVTGDTVDTNTAWLAGAIRDRGHRVVGAAMERDDVAAIADAVERFRRRVDVLVVTGGLGPTLDDITRDGVAAALGRRLVIDEEVLADLKARYGRQLGAGSERQALAPRGARRLDNPVGTAPGFLLRYGILTGEGGGFSVACLPGVPSEMKAMATALMDDVFSRGDGVAHRKVRACGLAESKLGERLADLMEADDSGCDIGITVHHAEHTITLRGEDDTRMAAVEAEVRRRLGEHVFGSGDDTLAGVVVAALARAGRTVTTVESCTGGLLAGALTAVPGSSEVFHEGVVTYAAAAKTARVGVPEALIAEHGMVSVEVARAMAEGGRRVTGADYSLAITGVAGPGGGAPDTPVGTVVTALASARGTETLVRSWQGTRDEIRGRSVSIALDMLRRQLARDESGARGESRP